MEAIKSSTPFICREKIKEVYNIVLNKDEETLQKYIAEFKEEFRNSKASDIAFPRGVNGLEDYSDKNTVYKKGCPINVRGSLIYNHLLKKYGVEKKYENIKSGEKIKYLYLVEPNTIQSNIIAFPSEIPKEFELEEFIDYKTQYEKSFIDPVKTVTDAIGWSTEKRRSLKDFLKKA